MRRTLTLIMIALAAIAGADWPSILIPTRYVKITQVRVDHDGNVILAGSRGDQADRGSVPYPHFYVIKMDTSGSLLWERTFSSGATSQDSLKDIAVDSNNRIVVAGQVETTPGKFDWLVFTYDSEGNRVWSRRDVEAGQGSPNAVIIDGDDNAYVGGWVTKAGDSVGRISKYRPDGTRGWSTDLNGIGEVTKVRLDHHGAVYGLGVTTINEVNSLDIALVKISRFGTRLWTEKYKGPGANLTLPLDLGIDGSNRPVVAEFPKPSGASADMWWFGSPRPATSLLKSPIVRKGVTLTCCKP